jgi:hypothetical protein
MAKSLEAIQMELGFSPLPTSPETPQFNKYQVRQAQAEAEKNSKNFFELFGQSQYTQGTAASTYRFFAPDFDDQRPFTTEVATELLDGIDDEMLIKKVLEAGQERGTGGAKKVAHEIKLSQKLYQDMANAGMEGFAAYMTSAFLDPVDTTAALGMAAAVSAATPPLAPVTGTATLLGVRGTQLFRKFQKAPALFATGAGAATMGGLELLRAQTVHDITGNHIMLATALGGGITGGFTKYGRYMQKRKAFHEIQQLRAEGKPLSAEQEAFVRQQSDDAIADYFTRMVDDADEFNLDTPRTDADFDSDSLIAGLTRKDFTDTTPEELAATSKQLGKFAKQRGVISTIARLKNSEDPILRWLGDGLALNSLGNKSGKGVGSNALEMRDSLVSATILKDAVKLSNLYKTATKKLGVKETEVEFMVGEAMRNPNARVIPEVREIANMYTANMDRMFKTAIEANAAGFVPEMFGKIQNYLPRIVNRQQVSLLRFGHKEQAAKLSDKADGELNDAFLDLGEVAIRNGQPDIELNMAKALKARGKAAGPKAVKAAIKQLARGYMRTLLNPKNNNIRKLGDGLASEDEARLALKDSGEFTTEQIDIILEVAAQTAKKVKGNPRARHRMQLDETAEVLAKADDGSIFTLRFVDLLETNGRTLYEKYLFQTAGAASLAANGIDTNKVGSGFNTIISKVKGGADSEQIAKEVKAAEFLYDSVTGKLPYREDWSYGTRRGFNRFREVSFAANMGMAGMSAVMELTNVLFETSASTLLKTVPQLNKLVIDARTGQLKNKAAHEMMVFTGTGGDGLMTKVTSVRSRTEGSIFEEYGTIQGDITPLDEWLGKARIFVSVASGLQGVTDMLRRLSMYNFATEWHTKAINGKIPFSRIKRQQMGIDDAMGVAINREIQKWAEINPQTGVLDVLNLQKWGSDVTGAERVAALEARNVFLRAARREATQSVQEVNNGSVNYLLRSEVGKSAFQFLSFPMASMEQQAGRLAVRAANGDALDVAKILTSAAGLGMLMYTARTHLNSLGRSDREDYVERQMQADRFWVGSLGQIGSASLLGYIYQVTTGVLDGQTKGLTPAAASWILSGAAGAKDLAQMIAGNDLTENELRSLLRILPFSSLYGARQILNGAASMAD